MRNVALIGLGKIGIIHAGIVNALPEARIKAICEKNALLLRVARKFLPKTVALYKDHLDMVKNEEIQAVFITTPIDTHVPIVSDLVRANTNLSLFVEKPLGSSAEQAKTACEAARKMQGIHMVGFQRRFSPVFQRAKQLIEDGSIGEMMFFRAHTFSSIVLSKGRSWRLRKGSGGVLLDLAPHLLDVLLWFFGEPSSVLAVKRRLYSKEVEDYVHAVISFHSGLKGHMDACWSIRSFRLPEMSIEIRGKNGTLLLTDDYLKVQLDKVGPAGAGGSHVYYKQSFDTSVPFLLDEPELTMEDAAFLLSMEKRTMPSSNFFQAAKVNMLIDQINKSATSREADFR